MKNLIFIAVTSLVAVRLAPARSADDILVRGKGIAITRSQLEEEEWCHFNEVGPMKAAMRPTLVDLRVLTSLINKYVILARATARDHARASEKFQANLRDHKATLKLTDAAFEQRLSRRLVLWRLTRKRWEERNIENCVMQLVLNREVESSISEEQMRAYYAQHAERFAVPELVRLRRVFVATVEQATGLRVNEKQLAEARAGLGRIIEQVRGGEDFASVARAFAESHSGEASFGEVSFPRGQMPAEVETAAFALRTGETSGVLESDSGCQVIQLIEKSPPRRQAMEEAAARIRASLGLERIPGYLERITREAGIEIVDEELSAEERAAAREKIASSSRPRPPAGPAPDFPFTTDLPK